MSSIKLQGDSSGNGVLTIAAPNTNVDRSITIPDKAGAIAVGAGTVVQAVWSSSGSATFTNTLSTSSFIHTGLSITPTSASNKILVTAAFQATKTGSNGAIDTSGYYFASIYRGTTQREEIGNAVGYLFPRNARQHCSFQDLDSPATTSSVTYYIKPSSVTNGTTNTFIIYDAILSLLEIVA